MLRPTFQHRLHGPTANKNEITEDPMTTNPIALLKELMEELRKISGDYMAGIERLQDKLSAERDALYSKVSAEQDALFSKILAERDALYSKVLAERDAHYSKVLAEHMEQLKQLWADREAEHDTAMTRHQLLNDKLTDSRAARLCLEVRFTLRSITGLYLMLTKMCRIATLIFSTPNAVPKIVIIFVVALVSKSSKSKSNTI